MKGPLNYQAYRHLGITKADRTATLTMDSGEKMNAANGDMHHVTHGQLTSVLVG